MDIIDDFFKNFMRVRLNKPMRATLDIPFAAEPVEAIITPKIDSRRGPVFILDDVTDASLPIHPFRDGMHYVPVRTSTGHRIETILGSWGPHAMGPNSRLTEGRLLVSQREFTLSDLDIAQATFCVEDLPRFIGQGAMSMVETHHMTQMIGQVELKSDGWAITLTESTTADPDFGISHNGSVRRADEGTFTVTDLKHLISGLTYFFSFVTGTYRMPAVVMAHSKEHNRVWGQYGRLHQSQYVGDNWFSPFHGSALSEMFPGFWKCYNSHEAQLKTVVGLYCESSIIAHNGLHKNALVTSRSALESISKWQLNRNRIPSKEIKYALDACGIPFDNQVLRRITDVRDSVDHGDFFTTDYQEFYDLWKQSQNYVELMLFKRFRYTPSQDHS